MRASKRMVILAALLGAGMLLWFAEPCAAGVYEGMVLCGQTLIPALFPFLVLCELLCALLPCRSPKSAAVLTVLLSAVGGYPAGVRAAERFYRRGALSPRAAATLALCCCNAGPAFLVTAVGVKLLGEQTLGFLLLGNNLCAMLLTLLTVWTVSALGTQENPPSATGRLRAAPFAQNDTAGRRDGVANAPQAVERAVRSMLIICGYTLLACCLLHTAKQWLGQGTAYTLLCGVLEITSGCRAFAHADRLPALAAVCAFGGVCVLGQNLSVAARCGVRWYALAGVRLLQAFYAFLLMLPFCRQPLLAVFSASDRLTLSVSSGNAATAVGIFLLLCALALLIARLHRNTTQPR